MELEKSVIENAFISITSEYMLKGATLQSLEKATTLVNKSNSSLSSSSYYNSKWKFIFIIVLSIAVIAGIIRDNMIIIIISKYIYETRCYVPNNYLVWEFSRPRSNCDFCRNVNEPLVLPSNITRAEFAKYAYSSRPIIVKNAAKHWRASRVFNLNYFKKLYEKIDGAYESVDEEGQFLHFKSNFTNLRQVFEMTEDRANGKAPPWYVGWKNCHAGVLEEINKYYDIPHFLPEDAEVPQTNYIFMGYEQGAAMHLDYIPRLMWQGQVLGRKTWAVAPTPECHYICRQFNFSVDTGDIILLDTRLFYHSSFVTDNKLSLSITSEYG